jgi:hypothetical protein
MVTVAPGQFVIQLRDETCAQDWNLKGENYQHSGSTVDTETLVAKWLEDGPNHPLLSDSELETYNISTMSSTLKFPHDAKSTATLSARVIDGLDNRLRNAGLVGDIAAVVGIEQAVATTVLYFAGAPDLLLWEPQDEGESVENLCLVEVKWWKDALRYNQVQWYGVFGDAFDIYTAWVTPATEW